MTERASEDLNRFWDAQLTGAATDPSAIDPTLVEAVRRLHSALDTRPRVDPSFVAALWDRLAVAPPSLRSEVRSAPDEMGTGGERTGSGPWVISPTRIGPFLERHRRLTFVAAVVVAAVLGGLAAAYLIGRDDASHTAGPAIHAPATPAPESTPADVVFEITLPADVVPHTAARFVSLQYVSIPPGVDSHWTPYGGTGPYGEYVLSGSYRERIAAAVEVVRADGSRTAVAANVELTLGPGDLLISRNEHSVETINDGAEPAEVLTWLFMDASGEFGGRQEEGWIGNTFTVKSDFSRELPDLPGAVTLRLQRMVIGADERVSPPAGGVQLPLPLDRLTETILKSSDGSYFKASNRNGAPVTVVYVLTLLPADPGGSAELNTPPP